MVAEENRVSVREPSMGKIRIRFVINTLAGGGAERVLINLLNSLDTSLYDVTVLSVSGGIHKKHLPPTVEHRQILGKRENFLLRSLIYHMPAFLFNCLFLRGDYDIEVAYLEGFPTKMLSRFRTDAAKIAFIHMDVSKDNTFDMMYRRKKQCLAEYSCFDHVCFVSEGAMKGYYQKYGVLDNGCVIHNVIDAVQIVEKSKSPAQTTFSTDGLKIVMVGRLEPVKGIDRVLSIASELQNRYAFQILVLGEGKEFKNLLQIKKEKNVESVLFLGFQENPYPILRQADLLLCASHYEGYSTAVAEALILGTPVLTTNCAGMKELLDDGKYGLIVENNEDALRKGLIHCLSVPNLCEQYRKAIQTDHSRNGQSVASEYEQLFHSAYKNSLK